MESLAHLGLGEPALRIGTNVLTILLVVAVAWLMQTLYKQANLGWTPGVKAAAEPTSTPVLDPAQTPRRISLAMDGIARQANLHTTIPLRPREDVVHILSYRAIRSS